MVLHATNLDLMFPKSLHEKKWLRMRITWNPCNAKKNAVEFRGLWCRKRCYHFVDGQVLEMVSWEVRLTVQFWRDIQTHQPNPWLTFYQICELYMVDPMFFEGTHAETILSIHCRWQVFAQKNFRFKIFRASFDWRIWPHESKGW